MYFDKQQAAYLGREGERRVAEYLRKKGYIIVKRNWRSDRYGEIDIIAEKGDVMAFVEVKTRRKDSLASGAEAVDGKKLNRTVNAANIFMQRLQSSLDMRIDVAEVTVSFEDDGIEWHLNYIENVG